MSTAQGGIRVWERRQLIFPEFTEEGRDGGSLGGTWTRKGVTGDGNMNSAELRVRSLSSVSFPLCQWGPALVGEKQLFCGLSDVQSKRVGSTSMCPHSDPGWAECDVQGFASETHSIPL